MTAVFFDDLEARDPQARAEAVADRLPSVIANATRAPGWAKRLNGVDPASINSREALAKLPLLRKSDLVGLQKAEPPFGGFNVLAAGQAKRILMSPGPIFEFESMEADPALAGAAKLWRFVAGQGKREVTQREAWQGVKGGRFERAADLEEPFRVLEERGYLRRRPLSEEERKRRGRPSVVYLVNPRALS